MRIAVLSEFKQKGYGGGDYEIFKFMKGLSDKGHEVNFFFVSNKSFYSYKNEKFKLYFKPQIEKRVISKFNWLINRYYNITVLESFLKRNSKNLDYIIGVQTHYAIMASRLGKKYGIKIANFVFEAPNLAMLNPHFKNAYASDINLQKIWSDFGNSLKNSEIILANSTRTSDYVKDWIGRAPNHIYNCVSVDDTLRMFNVNLNFNLVPDHTVIYVGRLVKDKNVDLIIKALEKITDAPRLVVIGGGPELENLKSLSNKLEVDCKFLGNTSEEVKYNEILKSKFMIFPSCFEGFGIPPSEALALGKPCLVSDLDILRKNYGSSLEYFQLNDLKDLVHKINKLLNDEQYLFKRGEKGKAFINGSSLWTKSVSKLEKALLKGKDY